MANTDKRYQKSTTPILDDEDNCRETSLVTSNRKPWHETTYFDRFEIAEYLTIRAITLQAMALVAGCEKVLLVIQHCCLSSTFPRPFRVVPAFQAYR